MTDYLVFYIQHLEWANLIINCIDIYKGEFLKVSLGMSFLFSILAKTVPSYLQVRQAFTQGIFRTN